MTKKVVSIFEPHTGVIKATKAKALAVADGHGNNAAVCGR